VSADPVETTFGMTNVCVGTSLEWRKQSTRDRFSGRTQNEQENRGQDGTRLSLYTSAESSSGRQMFMNATTSRTIASAHQIGKESYSEGQCLVGRHLSLLTLRHARAREIVDRKCDASRPSRWGATVRCMCLQFL